MVNFNQTNNYLNAPLVVLSQLNACSPLLNASEVSGKMVLIQRGSCEFGFKALMAENARAIGVIVYNNTAGYVYMAAGVNGASVNIPVLFISQRDGQKLHHLLYLGETINLMMGNLANVNNP